MTEPKYRTVLIRITLPNGQQIERRYIGLSAAVAEYPEAQRVEIVPEHIGAFW